VTFVLAPSKDTDHHRLKLVWVKDLISRVLVSAAVPVPVPLFSQVHGDWAKSIRKAFGEQMRIDRVVCELEHLYRNVKGKDANLGLCPVSKFMERIRCATYMAGPFNFSYFWEVHRFCMRSRWQCPGFAKYWFKERVWSVSAADGQTLYNAYFWCGMYSRVRAGHEASQNIQEQVMKVCRDVAEMMGGSAREDEFLEKIEERCAILCNTPGFAHSMSSVDQEHRIAPLCPRRPSPDLISGDAKVLAGAGSPRM